MKNLLLACCCVAAALDAVALVVRPETLPPSPWADTEMSTNVVFATCPIGPALRDFHIDMSLLATPSNNVQVALGRDADEDGVLSLAETDFSLGWDCGSWWFNRTTRWEPATTNDVKDLSWTLRMRNGAPHALNVVENGTLISSVTNAAALADFYSPDWNLMRITVRGVDAAAERLVVAAYPWGCVLRVR